MRFSPLLASIAGGKMLRDNVRWFDSVVSKIIAIQTDCVVDNSAFANVIQNAVYRSHVRGYAYFLAQYVIHYVLLLCILLRSVLSRSFCLCCPLLRCVLWRCVLWRWMLVSFIPCYCAFAFRSFTLRSFSFRLFCFFPCCRISSSLMLHLLCVRFGALQVVWFCQYQVLLLCVSWLSVFVASFGNVQKRPGRWSVLGPMLRSRLKQYFIYHFHQWLTHI